MSKRILCFLLALFFVLPLFAACTPQKDPQQQTVSPIVADGLSEYKIVYSYKATSQNYASEKEAAVRLRDSIKEATGVILPMEDDYFTSEASENGTAKEILVGHTKRPASEEAFASLREKDYLLSGNGNQVVLVGGTANATAQAVMHFIANYVDLVNARVENYTGEATLRRHHYLYLDVTVSGVPLSSYSIVYPKGSGLMVYNAAVNLRDFLHKNMGVVLPLRTEFDEGSEYEILMGDTGRAESDAVKNLKLESDEYILQKNGNKIVCYGNSYMLAGAASALVNRYMGAKNLDARVNVDNLPTTASPAKFTFAEKAKSAILLIGDGMGQIEIEAALASGVKNFSPYLLPYRGWCKTASVSELTGKAHATDSAAAATALATGYKTINGYVGIDKDGTRRPSVLELAGANGARTAVVTTDRNTSATPAGFLAHVDSRYKENEILKQIYEKLDDGAYAPEGKPLTGLQYVSYGRVGNNIVEITAEALSAISDNNGAFFAMIEEAYVDQGGHNNDFDTMYTGIARMDEVSTYLIPFVIMHPDTVLIITADHETGGLQKNENGGYSYTRSGSNAHTNVNVPVFAIGPGVEALFGEEPMDNTDIAKFIAGIFGATTFGQQE